MVKPSNDKPNGNNDCRFKGIRKRKWGSWVSEIRLPNSRERIWLGSYDTPEKAARAFDAAVLCLRGPTAKFNFPADPPAFTVAPTLSPAEIQAIAVKYANEGHGTAELNPPEQSVSESSLSASRSPIPADRISTHSDSELDWSFMELLTAGTGENRMDSGNPGFFSDQFIGGDDFPVVDLGEEFGFPQESFLWNF